MRLRLVMPSLYFFGNRWIAVTDKTFFIHRLSRLLFTVPHVFVTTQNGIDTFIE
jgi:hypothetical protein